MTKRELINALEAHPLPDDAVVKLYDHEKMAHSPYDGEPTGDGLYDFEVSTLNDDLSQEDIDECKECFDVGLKPFIVLVFDNPDFDDDYKTN